MIDISGNGVRVTLLASKTFPATVSITQFADDADPVDVPSQQLADGAMGVNGDFLTWSKANPVPMTLNVIPFSDDDRNLSILAQVNLSSRGRKAFRDVINAVITYPNGRVVTLANGRLMDAPIGDGIASSGRAKTKAYQFKFETLVSVG